MVKCRIEKAASTRFHGPSSTPSPIHTDNPNFAAAPADAMRSCSLLNRHVHDLGVRIGSYEDEDDEEDEEDDDDEEAAEDDHRSFDRTDTNADPSYRIINTDQDQEKEDRSHSPSSAQPAITSSPPADVLIESKKKSVPNAAISFHRWRNLHLKTVFNRELQKVLQEAESHKARLAALEDEVQRKDQHLVHALADSAQLRTQLTVMEDVHRQEQEYSEVEMLREELSKALERACSSESEVERYNREIRKLREKLKSMEDEANRLDMELKASVAHLQKEKEGVLAENRVLLEQLARKDEEVISLVQETKSLKSMVACIKFTREGFECSKSELQDNSGEPKYAKPEVEEPFTETQFLLQRHTSSSESIASRIFELLQKLIIFLQRKETQEKNGVSHLECQENTTTTRAGKDCCPDIAKQNFVTKPNNNANSHMPRTSDAIPIHAGIAVNGSTNGVDIINTMTKDQKKSGKVSSKCSLELKERRGDLTPSTARRKMTNLFEVTCWKWRWTSAASQVKALSRELQILKSRCRSKADRRAPFLPASRTVGHENFRSSMQRIGYHNLQKQTLQAERNDKVPVTFENVFPFLESVWKTASKSADLEKQLSAQNRCIDSLLSVLTRWRRKKLQKMALVRVIFHWLRYLLQSRRERSKTCTVCSTPCSCSCSRLQKGPLIALPVNLQKSPNSAEIDFYDHKLHNKDGQLHRIATNTSTNTKKVVFTSEPLVVCQTIHDDKDRCKKMSAGSAVGNRNLASKRIAFSNQNSNSPDCSSKKERPSYHWNLNNAKERELKNATCIGTRFQMLEKNAQTCREKLVQILQFGAEHNQDEFKGMLINQSPTFISSLWKVYESLERCLVEAHSQIVLFHTMESNDEGENKSFGKQTFAKQANLHVNIRHANQSTQNATISSK